MIDVVKNFNEKFMEPLNPNIRMHDIVSEIGEMAKEIIKSQEYGNKDFELTDEMVLEYGDALYSMISFGLENNIDIKGTLNKIIEKYENRFAKKGHIGSNE